jgi:hypothetical protein
VVITIRIMLPQVKVASGFATGSYKREWPLILGKTQWRFNNTCTIYLDDITPGSPPLVLLMLLLPLLLHLDQLGRVSHLDHNGEPAHHE